MKLWAFRPAQAMTMSISWFGAAATCDLNAVACEVCDVTSVWTHCARVFPFVFSEVASCSPKVSFRSAIVTKIFLDVR